MIKRFVIFIALLLMLAACGCGQQEETVVINIEAPSQNDSAAADAPQQEDGAASSGQTIIGRVESIVGNEVTLALGAMEAGGNRPEGAFDFTESANGETPSQRPNDGTKPNGMNKRGSGQMPEGTNFQNGGGMPDGVDFSSFSKGEKSFEGMPQGEGFAGKAGQRGGMGANARGNITYSGETAVYLLPVGMSIGTGDFTSVSEGMVLQLSLNDEGTITAVSILSR